MANDYPHNFTEGTCTKCRQEPFKLQGFCHAVCEVCCSHDLVSSDFRGIAYTCSDCQREQYRQRTIITAMSGLSPREYFSQNDSDY